jgi:hypothetical protein
MNAREEFLEQTKAAMIWSGALVRCAEIQHQCEYDANIKGFPTKTIRLKWDFDEVDLNRFLAELDFEYDHSFGGQRLFGLIWFTDGSWMERGEYDGSEWWEYKKMPRIPEELK